MSGAVQFVKSIFTGPETPKLPSLPSPGPSIDTMGKRTADEAAAKRRTAARLRGGLQGTILTGPLGLPTDDKLGL